MERLFTLPDAPRGGRLADRSEPARFRIGTSNFQPPRRSLNKRTSSRETAALPVSRATEKTGRVRRAARAGRARTALRPAGLSVGAICPELRTPSTKIKPTRVDDDVHLQHPDDRPLPDDLSLVPPPGLAPSAGILATTSRAMVVNASETLTCARPRSARASAPMMIFAALAMLASSVSGP